MKTKNIELSKESIYTINFLREKNNEHLNTCCEDFTTLMCELIRCKGEYNCFGENYNTLLEAVVDAIKFYKSFKK